MNDVAQVTSTWYSQNQRSLPWRHAAPWHVLVSEIMLQQTPVARVLPVFSSWMERWPTPRALASASPEDVVRAWGKLGYPRRALNLLSIARALVQDHDGEVPADLEALLALPGIGSYTARAVLTFAFQQRHGVVDTNVRRVIARSVEGKEDALPSAHDVQKAEALLPPDPSSAAHVSAALMELGALVCTKRSPLCAQCPLVEMCAWYQAGSPSGPVLRKQKPYAGSDREARGRLLDVLRSGGLLDEQSAQVVPDPLQRARCLASLEADGLLVRTGAGWALPS